MAAKQQTKKQLTTQAQQLKVTLVRSPIGHMKRHRDCLRALGLRRMQSSKVHNATPSVLGLINKVGYLLQVDEI